MRLHHIGMLVSDIAAGQALLERYFQGTAQGPATDDPLQQATVQFYTSGGVTIELIAPLGEQSHLHNVLARSGEGLAHLCYETATLSETIVQMKAAGALLISRKPATAFDGKEVAFLFLPNKMVIELVQA